jgi:hypothetical protein
MSGVFDRLSKQIIEQAEKQGEGLSPIEIAKLPPLHRWLVRLLLRELEMTEPALKEATAEMPDDKRPTDEELSAALKDMCSDGWVIRMGQGEVVTYRANLRRKAPSKLAKSIWASLNSRIEEGKTETGGQPKEG